MKSILVRLYSIIWMQTKSTRTTPTAFASKRFVHRIKATGMKRMASKKATQGEIQTTNHSVAGKSFYGIL